jgi:REP element-mobilizing transposase RayT
MGTKGTTSYRIGNQNALHYITIATVEWIDLFTRSKNKDIIINSLKYCREKKGLEPYAYCIMSNHIHMLCRAKEDFRLSDILRDFKRHTAKQLLQSVKDKSESRSEWILEIFRKAGSENPKNKEYQIWRQDNHPIELFSNTVIDQKFDYIHNNPVEEGIVEKAEDYLYSSARNYAELNVVLEIDFL